LNGYDGLIAILDTHGSAIGDAHARLTHKPCQDNPNRWAGSLDIPGTPEMQQWLRETHHEIAFRTLDGRAGSCVSFSFPGKLPGSIDVFGKRDAPFD
jgi:hypothetical protein